MSGSDSKGGSALRRVGLAMILGSAAVVSCVMLVTPSQEDVDRMEAERAADPTSGSAYACRENIRAVLLSPSSVEWGHWAGWPATVEADGVVRVSAELEASNSYGVQLRQRFVCRVRKDDGTWFLVSLEEG